MTAHRTHTATAPVDNNIDPFSQYATPHTDEKVKIVLDQVEQAFKSPVTDDKNERTDDIHTAASDDEHHESVESTTSTLRESDYHPHHHEPRYGSDNGTESESFIIAGAPAATHGDEANKRRIARDHGDMQPSRSSPDARRDYLGVGGTSDGKDTTIRPELNEHDFTHE